METVSIVTESLDAVPAIWRAVAGDKESVGKTAGEALDALTANLGDEDLSTMIVLRKYRPDRFFTAAQQQRLSELMKRWRNARDAGQTLPGEEQSELETLIDAELLAAAQRSEQLAWDMEK